MKLRGGELVHGENAWTRNVHRHAATAVRDCGVASGEVASEALPAAEA